MHQIAALTATIAITFSSLAGTEIARTVGETVAAPAAEVVEEATGTVARPAVTFVNASDENVELTLNIVDRFSNAGLELPPLVVTFSDDDADCKGNAALHHEFIGNISVCQAKPYALAHEMAHAWAAVSLTDADRTAYTELWDLPTWNSHEFAWSERATEKAADTIAFTLTSENPEPSDNLRTFLCTYESLTGKPFPRTLTTPCAPELSAAV